MDRLQKLISSEEYEKLTLAKITSLKTLVETSTRDLHLTTNLSFKSIEDVTKKASHIISPKLVTAYNVKPWEKLSTGSKLIDIITNGGIPIQGINEIVGCSGVGKTQLCLQLSIMCQLPKQYGGREKGVVYINTDSAFPSIRFHDLSQKYIEKYQLNVDLGKNVFLQHIANYDQIKRTLYVLLPSLLLLNDIGLIIIDSIAGIFRSENLDVIYSNRSQQFVKIVTQLNELGKKFNVCIICINQVSENLDTSETVPALGLSWSNLVNCRFCITRFRESNLRRFETVFSPHLPNTSCDFVIDSDGIH